MLISEVPLQKYGTVFPEGRLQVEDGRPRRRAFGRREENAPQFFGGCLGRAPLALLLRGVLGHHAEEVCAYRLEVVGCEVHQSKPCSSWGGLGLRVWGLGFWSGSQF